MVIGHECESLYKGLHEAVRVVLSQEFAILPFDKWNRDPFTIVAAKSFRDFWRDVLIKQELEHTKTNEPFRKCLSLAFYLFSAASHEFRRLRQHAF